MKTRIIPMFSSYRWGISKSKNIFSLLFRIDVQCEALEMEMNHLFPAVAIKGRECFLQKEVLLFSCAGISTKHQRLCPCRDFLQGQVALCKDCLWALCFSLTRSWARWGAKNINAWWSNLLMLEYNGFLKKWEI